MDEAKLRSALAMLQAIADKLPANGDIEEKYVDLYHNALRGIQQQLGCDLDPFLIPSGELEHHLTSFRYGPNVVRHRSQRSVPDRTYSKQRYCDRARFDIALAGAINFISGHLQSPSPLKLKNV